MFEEKKLLQELEKTMDSIDLSERQKVSLCHTLLKSKSEKENVNVLLVGATGSGKSSTINAILGKEIAKVGVGVDPETMEIEKYTMPGLVLWDSPGLGDGIETDARFRTLIVKKLSEMKENGDYLIDLVLVVIEGGSRDLGTTYEIVNKLIMPCLGEKPEEHLLIGINQCDFAMKGRHWNFDSNTPDSTLLQFLEEKVVSLKNRIKEATGVQTSPFYYSAGQKEVGQAQNPPYHLTDLLMPMVRYCPTQQHRAIRINLNAVNPEGFGTVVGSLGSAIASALKGIEGTNSEGKTFSGGGDGCYITTAICSDQGKPDNCYELTMFRNFRDKWLILQEDGAELIQRYYLTAPRLVKKIDLQDNSAEIYQNLKEHYLNPCLDFLEHGEKQQCKERYTAMMEFLYEAESTFLQ